LQILCLSLIIIILIPTLCFSLTPPHHKYSMQIADAYKSKSKNKCTYPHIGPWVGVHVPADVGVTTIPDIWLGLTTIPEAGKVPPDTSTTGAPDISLRLV
jgi:hypothetical protein